MSAVDWWDYEKKPFNCVVMSASAYQNKCLFWSIWTSLVQMIGLESLAERRFGFKAYLELFADFLPEKVWNLDGSPSFEMVSILGGTHLSKNDLERGVIHQGGKPIQIDGLAETEEGRAVFFCLELARRLGLRFEFWSIEKLGDQSDDVEKRLCRLLPEPIEIGTGINCVRIALYSDHFYLIIDRWENRRTKDYMRALVKEVLNLEHEWFTELYPKLYKQYADYVGFAYQSHQNDIHISSLQPSEKVANEEEVLERRTEGTNNSSKKLNLDEMLAQQMARVYMK